MAKSVNIDTPSTDLPEDVQAAIAAQNAKETKNILMKQGVTILYQQETKTTFTSTATTFTKLAAWEAAFATSGGIVDIEFISSVLISTTMTVKVKLIIDNDEDLSRICTIVGTAAFTFLMDVKLKKLLTAGNHIAQIYVYVDTGTATFSAQGASTEMTVTETII